MPITPDECQDLLVLCPAEIDGQDLLRRIHANRAQRLLLPPAAAALGRAKMLEQRRKILTSIRDLQDRVRDCGRVRCHRTGWIAALEILVKKIIRKVFFRHFLQQHRVHLKLVTVLGQLTRYLEDEDACLRSCIDQSDRQRQEASALERS